MHNSRETALLAAEAADDKKASNILILDLRGLTYIADYFMICSGNNPAQVGAVSDWIEESLARTGERVSHHIEGQTEASWVLMDYGDMVVHIFDEEARVYYNLEKLWGDAPRVPLQLKAGSQRAHLPG
jgi:ribosome-associated protein